MERRLSGVRMATAAVLLTGVVAVGAGPVGSADSAGSVGSVGSVASRAPVRPPLAGRTVVLDPGHQLGNATHRAQIARRVDAGGFDKPCNTVGAVTDDGYREPTFAFSVAAYARRRLTALGARVYQTRWTNSASRWGPCVDTRGQLGNMVHADAVVAIHADNTAPRFHGFFVIQPGLRRGWTDDIVAASRRLALDVRSGMDRTAVPRANYNGGDGLDTRTDLGNLNWSDVPVVLVELGNMRNAGDAARMRSADARDRVYAGGLTRGLTAFLRRSSPAGG